MDIIGLNKSIIMSKKIIRVISSGGLGDVLLSTPSFYALKKKYPKSRIIVFCKNERHKELYKHNPYIDRLTIRSFWINPFSSILYYLNWAKFYVFEYGRMNPSLYYKRSAAEIIAEMLDITLEETKLQAFLTKEEDKAGIRQLSQYKNPVILHIDTMSSKNKEWSVSKWEELVRAMPEYTFVQLGVAKDTKVEGAVDLRGKTTFRQGMALVKNALSFVGVDSSFSHVTNIYDIPGVVLFGPSTPVLWGHPNNINIYKSLRCSPCIDILLGTPCPYGRKCMTAITVEEVRSALLKQLGKMSKLSTLNLTSYVSELS
jgi:ADP-heptose:LPS heptosyltransferase